MELRLLHCRERLKDLFRVVELDDVGWSVGVVGVEYPVVRLLELLRRQLELIFCSNDLCFLLV
jgi:hypothetical protein